MITQYNFSLLLLDPLLLFLTKHNCKREFAYVDSPTIEQEDDQLIIDMQHSM